MIRAPVHPRWGRVEAPSSGGVFPQNRLYDLCGGCANGTLGGPKTPAGGSLPRPGAPRARGGKDSPPTRAQFHASDLYAPITSPAHISLNHGWT